MRCADAPCAAALQRRALKWLPWRCGAVAAAAVEQTVQPDAGPCGAAALVLIQADRVSPARTQHTKHTQHTAIGPATERAAVCAMRCYRRKWYVASGRPARCCYMPIDCGPSVAFSSELLAVTRAGLPTRRLMGIAHSTHSTSPQSVLPPSELPCVL